MKSYGMMNQAPSLSSQRVVLSSFETVDGSGKGENVQLIVVVGHVEVREGPVATPFHKAA